MAGFVLVIPEQMMCLRPYGRPLGLLCAVTDVAHVNFKGFLLHFKNPPPSPSAAADLQDEWGVSSMLIWQSVPFVLYTASSPPPPPPPHPCSPAACTLTAPDFVFLGERDRLKCPVQPTAAAPGPRHSSAQRRREGRGLGAPLCGAPPVVLCSLCPLRRVLAGAFV